MNIYYVIHIHLVHNFQNVQDMLHFQEKRFDIWYYLILELSSNLHYIHDSPNVQAVLHFQEGRFDVSFNLKQLHFGNKVVLFLFITIQADCIALSREGIWYLPILDLTSGSRPALKTCPVQFSDKRRW